MNRTRSFGKYVLHLKPLRLMEGRRTVSLSPRQLQVLTLLVKAGGEFVSKEEFTRNVWQGAFVDPGNLSQTVFLLRKMLGKLPDGGELIETVPRLGYRLSPKAVKLGREAVAEEKKVWKKTADQKAPHAEEHFRLLVESITDYAIYMLDCAGRVETWNPGIEQNKGYTAEEVIGQHYSLFFVAEDIEARVPERELARAARHGSCAGEGWRIKKNGERFWASFVISAMRSSTGALLGFAKVVKDLSDRRNQEDAVRQAEALAKRERDRLSAAAESSMDALFICEAVRDAAGEIVDFIFTYLNSNVEKMVAIPRGTLLRGKMCELLPVNQTMGLFDRYKQVVLTGDPYLVEFAVEAENITSEWIRVHAVRLGDGVVVTASDISERKRLEFEVLELRKKLREVDAVE